jgi:hypothetical protein
MREILAAADAPDSRMGLAAVPRRSVHPGQFAEPEFEPEVEPERARGGRRQAVVVAIAALLMIAAGLTLYWQRDRVRNLFARSPATQVQREAAPSAASRPKISDRVGQAGQPNTSGNQDAGAGAAVAQRVVLYEDDPGDPQGKPYVGTVLWQTETKPSSAEQSAETSIRGELEIPDRRVKMTMLVRRNFDKALPASHTIEIMFNLPADFPFGGISNVPGILMKPAEQTRGSPLAGLAVKVTSGYFLIGLSGAEEDMKRNLELLKDRAWFDIPIVYSNGRRAILAVEKGTPGDRAFQQAFAAWGE